MGVWLPSTWLAHSTFALLVSAALASCGSAARGSILLISLPDGTIEKHLQGDSSIENWPWGAPASPEETEDAPSPAVSLAPELSAVDAGEETGSENGLLPSSATMGEGWNAWVAMATAEPGTAGSLLSAVGAALTQVHATEREIPRPDPSARDSLGSFFNENIIRGFMNPAGVIGWDRVSASVARLRAQGSELHTAIVDPDRWDRFLRASLEAEQVALAEGREGEELSQVEAPAAEAAPLEAAPPVAAAVHLPTSHVRFSALARPLILKLAGALNEAGDSLESLAKQLDKKDAPQSAPTQSTADKQLQATGQSIIKPKSNATVPPQDPQAEEFFEF